MHNQQETLILEARTLVMPFIYLYYTACILSLGIVPITMRMFPLLKIKWTTCRSSLDRCTHVLVQSNTGFEFVEVDVINLKKFRKFKNSVYAELKSYIHDDTVRVLTTNFMRFVYDYGKECFVRPSGRYSIPLSNHIMYGENTLATRTYTVSQIVVRHFTSNLFLYILVCVFIWSQIDYLTYSVILLVMALYSIINDVIVDIRNKNSVDRLSRIKKSMSVFRDNRFRELNTRNLFPNDIVAIAPGEIEADVQILSGEVIVDESFLTGESIPVYKKKGGIVRAGTVVMECREDNEPFCPSSEYEMVRINVLDDRSGKRRSVRQGTAERTGLDRNGVNEHELDGNEVNERKKQERSAPDENMVSKESNVNGEMEYETGKDKQTEENMEYAAVTRDTTGIAGKMAHSDRGHPSPYHKHVIGRVISTGFNTTKGTLIRNILLPAKPNLKFFNQSKKLLLIMFCIGTVISILYFLFSLFHEISVKNSLYYSIDLIVTIITPALPAAIWIGMNLSVKSLKLRRIMCNDINRINTISEISTVVFDKTGTLTEDGLDVHMIDVERGDEDEDVEIDDVAGSAYDKYHSGNYYNAYGNNGSDYDAVTDLKRASNLRNSNDASSTDTDNTSTVVTIAKGHSAGGDNNDASSNAHPRGTAPKKLKNSFLMLIGMSTCHSVVTINNECLGDPLDVKMFKYSKASMHENTVTVNDDVPHRCRVLHINEFDPTRRRMSVVVEFEGKRYVFVKGSAESIGGLLRDKSEVYDKRSNEHALEGYRVIAMAYRCIDEDCGGNRSKIRKESNGHDDDSLSRPVHREQGISSGTSDRDQDGSRDKNSPGKSTNRDEIANRDQNKHQNYGQQNEQSLTFLGFIIFANKLKPATIPVIHNLKLADITCLMATGDNILTAISVAKECGMIEQDTPIIFPVLEEKNEIEKNEMEWCVIGEGSYYFDKLRRKLFKESNEVEYVIAIEGREFEELLEDEQILDKTIVYARMNPEQKKMLCNRMECIFVGDGANDVGALQSSTVGLALNKNAATMNSAFVSDVLDISSVEVLIREGRCALVTSFCTFRFMLFTSLNQFISFIVMMLFFVFASEVQTMHYDIAIVIPVAYTIGLFKCSHTLSMEMPRCEILSVRFVFTFVMHLAIDSVFLLCCAFGRHSGTANQYEYKTAMSTLVFFMTAVQAVNKGIILTDGQPHREGKMRKKPFVLVIVLSYLVLIAVFVLMLFNGTFVKWYDFEVLTLKERVLLVAGIFFNTVISFLFEYVLKERMLMVFWGKEDTVSEYDE
ncbi:HAD ATPase, P-type, family IC [Vavraia culicis subsp. floridensis]|uniref:Cation-transporting ATPase n=1 Tax=Vavraia culicis (isolate floridensis) TaxID=948595 RepID=L2GVT6_VAVCU|nr:HAD ATPase, P-type, family IC [Vavraia culicis subsp. floridensis]ELA47791.2 HAD ATPase, P-type, family IC [Vavraia culicis subsp. floridensis]